MGDHFATVYEATAHRITGPVSNTALDLVGIGPGYPDSGYRSRRRGVEWSGGGAGGYRAGDRRRARHGPAACGTAPSLPSMRGSADGRRGSHRFGRKLRCCIFDLWRNAVFRLAPRSAGAGPRHLRVRFLAPVALPGRLRGRARLISRLNRFARLLCR